VATAPPPTVDPASWELGSYAPQVDRQLANWTDAKASSRIWRGDPSFWPKANPADVRTRLGWLGLPTTEREELDRLRSFAQEVRNEGIQEVLLLGMGGSSLAPQVFAATFGPGMLSPKLRVLDSTHPDAVRAARTRLDLAHTLFVVSSKSGTTLEPNAFLEYFWEELRKASIDPAPRFVAITDPGTPLEALAKKRGFRQTFLADPNVGGRYSALTLFGLVPAALLGADVGGILVRARQMAEACGPEVPAEQNPGLRLGAALGALARAGRDKVTFVTSPGLRAFPAWAEQLIAESTGKSGTGIVPVADEVWPLDASMGADEVAVYVGLRSEANEELNAELDQAAIAGMPVLRFELAETIDLGQELYRWELGVASSGAILGIDPFDQPDVELAKELARQAMESTGSGAATAEPAALDGAIADELPDWLGQARTGDYVAVQAFLAPTAPCSLALQGIRTSLRMRLGLSTTAGFGPRFLHSTGQLHKGGPPTGLFLQLTDHPTEDLPVPGGRHTFGQIVRAQAQGDAEALRKAGRRLLTIDLGPSPLEGMKRLSEAIRG
jgi:transaldolase/glucose-6-phosphate isomerase